MLAILKTTPQIINSVPPPTAFQQNYRPRIQTQQYRSQSYSNQNYLRFNNFKYHSRSNTSNHNYFQKDRPSTTRQFNNSKFSTINQILCTVTPNSRPMYFFCCKTSHAASTYWYGKQIHNPKKTQRQSIPMVLIIITGFIKILKIKS